MMTYSRVELSHFQELLDAFQGYLATSPYFDILFSPKQGYMHLSIEKNFVEVTPVDDPDELFDFFMSEITSDVRDLFMCGEHIEINLYPPEVEESRRRLLVYINRLPEGKRDHYTARMESYFEHCNDPL